MSHKLVDFRKKIPQHKTKKWKTRTSVDSIVVHTSASNQQDPVQTALYHIGPNHISKTGCPSLAYHDFITKNGIVYHCNDYEYSTWHAGLYNNRSIGIVLAFTGQTGEKPIESQLIALEEHLTILCLYLKILPENILGHREVPGYFTILGNGSKTYKKTCPGMGINLDELRKNITFRLQTRLQSEKLYRGKIDGIFGPKSITALKSFAPLPKQEEMIDID